MTSLTQQALVFIGSAVVLVPIFKFLGFGSVLGYLIAGILVGPHVLGLIPESEGVIHFSELGVVFLLFIIGLEIQPKKLWSMRRHLAGLGGAQIFLSTAIFSVLVYGFSGGFSNYMGWAELSPLASVVIGFGLSLSSTAFAVQTLLEKHQFNTEFGRGSFSILLMQDLVAIPALAIIPALAVSNASSSVGGSVSGLSQALMGLSVIVALVIVSRFLMRPWFRMIAATRSREIFTAATLLIVLGVAALMQAVGLSAALGTFIAGVLLAESEYRHEIEANIEPFKSLLMGLFFIGVGLGVSVPLILGQPFLVFGLALIYLLLKSLIIYGVGRVSKMNHENSKRMALTISQGGEFAFVLFGISLQLAQASAGIVSLLMAVITVSMALNPLVIILNDKLALKFLKPVSEPKYDEIKDETPEIIVAGFGRFGQVFARILRAQDIPFVAIDHDSDQIELVRRFGNKVYYGDVSRLDLLEAAGAGKAKFFVLAIDDVEASLKTANLIREHFPNLKIYARARNRGHAFDLMALGVTMIKRELFDSSLYFMRDLLVEIGFKSERADGIVERFRRHDEMMLIEQFKVRDDDQRFVSVSKQAAAQLSQVLNNDETRSYIGSPNSPQ